MLNRSCVYPNEIESPSARYVFVSGAAPVALAAAGANTVAISANTSPIQHLINRPCDRSKAAEPFLACIEHPPLVPRGARRTDSFRLCSPRHRFALHEPSPALAREMTAGYPLATNVSNVAGLSNAVSVSNADGVSPATSGPTSRS